MRIGIVNSVVMARKTLRTTIASTQSHEVAWEASNGREALEKCSEETPDLILMDLDMPVMNGVEATQLIMKDCPCAILVVTASVVEHHSLIFEALSAGARDVVRTPVLTDKEPSDFADSLLEKIGTIDTFTGRSVKRKVQEGRDPREDAYRNKPLIVIGASTGGPKAVATVLSSLSENQTAAIVVIIHIEQKFANGMAEWMDGLVRMKVRVASEGESPKPGTVLLASTNNHLLLTRDNAFHYTPKPRDYPYRPSVDEFFYSVASHWKGEAIGVLLTGMGKDGAEGLMALRQKGWHTIAQDEESSAIYGMPKAAVDLGAAKEILPLDRIGHRLACLTVKLSRLKENSNGER